MIPTLVYDADCAFCTRSARWIERRWRPGVARIRPSGSFEDRELASHGLTRADVEAAAWWIAADGSAHRGELAVAAALRAATGGTRLVGLLLALPGIRTAARSGYALVARNRHRLPGGSPDCTLPPEIARGA
ncbi:MAG: thiol-disulfide oxidoreductase DCC family protein [Actinomycetes bacterium]